MPKDFSEDGAFGAGGGGTDGVVGSPVGAIQMGDWGMNHSGSPAAPAPAPPTPTSPPPAWSSAAPSRSSSGVGLSFPSKIPASGTGMFDNAPFPGQYQNDGFQMSYEDGGAIDDSDGSPQQDAIQKALSTVDGVLAYGRKLHGLGGGDNQGAIQMNKQDQMDNGRAGSWRQPIRGNQPTTFDQDEINPTKEAGLTRMPGQPPSQSESGVPPLQPSPGALPPTNNPFGKRASPPRMAQNDSDNDDNSGAIDTEEETA